MSALSTDSVPEGQVQGVRFVSQTTLYMKLALPQPNNPIHFYRVGGLITFVSQETTSVFLDFEPGWWATGSTLRRFTLVAFLFLTPSFFLPLIYTCKQYHPSFSFYTCTQIYICLLISIWKAESIWDSDLNANNLKVLLEVYSRIWFIFSPCIISCVILLSKFTNDIFPNIIFT